MPDWLDIVIRSFVLVVILFLVTKGLGKKQISQLSFFEYATGITIGSIGAEVATRVEANMFHGVLSIVVFALAPFFTGVISLKSKPFRDFVDGKGTVFIKDGKIMEDNLKKERYTADELLELLRKKNVFNVADVEYAVLEAAGDLNVLLKKENQPLTAKDLKLPVASVKEPQTVIIDGKIMDEPLSTIGRSRKWLLTEVGKKGVTLENIFLGQVNSYGELAIDIYDDKLQAHSPQERPLILAAMRQCQADLESFALAADNGKAREMYVKNSEKLQKAIDKITYILTS